MSNSTAHNADQALPDLMQKTDKSTVGGIH